ncbi:hypothetical protein ACFFK0_21995 [Paenibacillus chartarius]|uniref:Uncharacterized protein n=1 Tax=Paenibacillus chartarius TaxID=747481 RepID=A0ABV6DR13_9BACL
MLNLSELENIHPDIEAVHEIVHQLKARIDGKEIGVSIFRNRHGHYFFELSHYYRGADNADPHIVAENRFDSAEEAARGALRTATLFYRSTDEGGRWIRNDSLLH